MNDPRFRLVRGDKQEVLDAFSEVPRVSYFSTSNGPNQASGSETSAAQGTFGVDVNPSARTVAWIAHRDGGSNWSEL